MLSQALRDLVATAREHAISSHDGADHTVAAALLTASGKYVLGLNAYHFLGGPCAEFTALANHAAEVPDDPVRAVVAVYGPTGQVISPCGKCRQVLYDLDSSISCVVRSSNGLEGVRVRDLLPYAYDWEDAENPQRIYMWTGYRDAIVSGTKRQTIRVDDPFTIGPAELVFEGEDGSVEKFAARVSSVRAVERKNLNDEHALKDGFSSLEQLQKALDQHYPGLRDEDTVDVVTFELV